MLRREYFCYKFSCYFFLMAIKFICHYRTLPTLNINYSDYQVFYLILRSYNNILTGHLYSLSVSSFSGFIEWMRFRELTASLSSSSLKIYNGLIKDVVTRFTLIGPYFVRTETVFKRDARINSYFRDL